MLTVVKVGGRAAESPDGLAALARDVAALSGRVVVVHGGGAEITRWQERVGLRVEWRDGLRVTTPEAVQLATMVLSGWTNKRLVAALLDAGEAAVGISGEDGGLLVAERKQQGALGEVGTVTSVNPVAVHALLAAGLLPVVSPVSRGPAGPLNVNADEAAIALAKGLGAGRLELISDVPGVLHEGVLVTRVSLAEARQLLEGGHVTGGMRVKLAQALDAAAAGIEVRIGDGTLLRDPGAGTRVVPEAAALEVA